MASATIIGLHCYPIKSCRGIALDRAVLGATGIDGDRRWMVVGPDGRGLTQRKTPRLALVVPSLRGNALSLTAPGTAPLEVDPRGDGQPLEVTVQTDRCVALDTGADSAEWLSRFLDEPVRLVRFDRDRTTNPEWGGASEPIAFPDAFPLLLISEASLADLNGRLESPLPMNRFRPNIVLGGLEPYAEDRIDRLVDGGMVLRTVYPCSRCKITTTDQITGDVAGPEPLVTLRKYRWSRDVPGVLFGRYAVIAGGMGAELRVGQRLAIEWQDPSNPVEPARNLIHRPPAEAPEGSPSAAPRTCSRSRPTVSLALTRCQMAQR